MSQLVKTYFLKAIEDAGLPAPFEEYRVLKGRRFRFDFAWPESWLALEVMGSVYTQGHHTRGQGYEDDCEKMNEATLLGWRVLVCSTGQVESGQALEWLRRALAEWTPSP